MGYLMPVSEMKNRHRGVERIGDTLFVDGSPHVECARCGIPIKLHDSRKIMVGRWPKSEDKVVIDSDTNEMHIESQRAQPKPYAGIKPKPNNGNRLPIIKSVAGCFDCWNLQQTEMLREQTRQLLPEEKRKIIFYPMAECEGKRNGLTAGKLPEIRKKTWHQGQASQKGFNTTITR